MAILKPNLGQIVIKAASALMLFVLKQVIKPLAQYVALRYCLGSFIPDNSGQLFQLLGVASSVTPVSACAYLKPL